MTEPVVGWPLTHAQRELVVMLGELARRAGAERFVSAPLVRADTDDFPDEWEPTIAAVHALLYRLFWLAHLDLEVVIDDARPLAPPSHDMLRTSVIELAGVEAGRVTFQVDAIGNDDVAGLLAHQVGAAFLELAPPDPFREVRREHAVEHASAAAVFLGLGVLVANSSMYRRHASRLDGREVHSEQVVAEVGGLAIAEATLLLAVQDAVREHHQEALATLLPPQAEWLERWREVLEPHEAELRALLELADRAPVPLARPPAPRVPAAVGERDLRKFNRGRTTFRVRMRRHGRAALGIVLGAAGFALPFGIVVGPVLMLACGAAGLRFAKREFECSDPECRALMATELVECPRCGGTIVDTIASAGQRLDRLHELEAGDSPDPHE